MHNANRQSDTSRNTLRRRFAREEVPPDALHAFDARYRLSGYIPLAGVDEAGRGPLAGPVVAAAVIFPNGYQLAGVNDSKRLTAQRRAELFERIVADCDYGIGIVEADEIDRLNILNATLKAAVLALSRLKVRPEHIITDYLNIDWPYCLIEPLVKGDAQSATIAAASIVAKVTRDRIMEQYAGEYPEYGFDANKGYGCAAHLSALSAHGPSSIHRLSFSGVSFFEPECRYSRTFQSLLQRCERQSLRNYQLTQILDGAAAHLPHVEKMQLRRRLSLPAGAEA